MAYSADNFVSVIPDLCHIVCLYVRWVINKLINGRICRVHTEQIAGGQDPDTPDDDDGVHVGSRVSDQPEQGPVKLLLRGMFFTW